MNFDEQLRILQAAGNDPAKLALATVDLAFSNLPDTERMKLKKALEAASVPHWCDVGILAALLELPTNKSALLLVKLSRLTVIEPFPARGDSALNVHEAARLALRRRLATDQPDWFLSVSQKAASYFEADLAPSSRIEWIYHRLCSSPDEAATELECLNREWNSSAQPEDRQALAAALRELDASKIIKGAFKNSTYAVSYAWREESHKVVEELCKKAEASGIRIVRDVTDLSLGEKFSEFASSLANKDRVFVIISDAYLRSENCMHELSEIWRLCEHDEMEFHKKVRVFRLPDARIYDLAYQMEIMEYWADQYDKLKVRFTLLASKSALPEAMIRRFNNLKGFANCAGEIMSNVSDRLEPKTFEEFVVYGFSDHASGPEVVMQRWLQ